MSPVTVWNHLRAKGMVTRDRMEAQIRAVTRYERKPFGGDKLEKAYLLGVRYGDLDVARHGRAIRARVSTTHPAMADLFGSLFSHTAASLGIRELLLSWVTNGHLRLIWMKASLFF